MSSIRKVLITATGIAATGIAAASFAGVNAGMMDQMNGGGSSSSSQSSAPSSSSSQSSAPSYSSPQSSAPSYSPPPVQRSAPSQSQPNFRNSQQNYRAPAGPNPRQQQSSAGPRPAAPSSAPSSAPSAARESQSRPNFRNSQQNYTAPVVSNPRPQASSGQQTPNGASTSSSSSEQRGGVIGRTLSRTISTGTPGNGNGGGHHNPGNPGQPGGNHDDDNHHPRPRPPNVVYVLPPYYYDYYWGGNLYYNFNGGWYSPYGSSYVSVGRPYGLYTRSLPANYSSFYYDDMRYYLHEDTYYTYDRSRGGYVVTPSPYGEDEEGADQDIFVYPAQGQSETQLADDRYACHRWAVRESGYDPLDDEYDRDRRSNYMRALTACLEGRGYTVK